MAHEFKPGDVFVFSPRDKGEPCKIDPDWVTSPWAGEERFALYEKISISKYPSSSDFYGEKILVTPGEVGIVLNVLGMPHSMWYVMKSGNQVLMDKYTVYEVMMKDKKINCFGNDMKSIVKYVPDKALSDDLQ